MARPRWGESPRPPHPGGGWGGVATAHAPATNCCWPRLGGTQGAHLGVGGDQAVEELALGEAGLTFLHPPPRSALALASGTLTSVTSDGTRPHPASDGLRQHPSSRVAPAPLWMAGRAPWPWASPSPAPRGTPTCQDGGSHSHLLARGWPARMRPKVRGLCWSPLGCPPRASPSPALGRGHARPERGCPRLLPARAAPGAGPRTAGSRQREGG